MKQPTKLNRAQTKAFTRFVRKDIGKDACVLCAAMAERAGYPVTAAHLAVALHEMPKADRAEQLKKMRLWISDFDAGVIVPDEELDND